MTELAQRLGLERGSVTGLVDRMSRDALVERGPDPQNRRFQRVRLTAHASRLLQHVREAVRSHGARTLQGMRDGEQRTLLTSLRRLVTRFEGEIARPGAPRAQATVSGAGSARARTR